MQLTRVQTAFEDERGEIKDIVERVDIDCVTVITSKKGAVRGNHYHKESIQYTYVLSGKLRLFTQMPGGGVEETVIERGDLAYTPPLERHAFIALEDSALLVLTKGPRGGKNYEDDIYRLPKPLSTPDRDNK